MNEKHVFICEDTIEGIFTAVYDAWAARVGHANVEIRTWEADNLELFCQYVHIPPDRDKAAKVIRTIKRELGRESFEQITYAACSIDKEKGTAIYQTLVEGLRGHINPHVMENLSNPYIRRVAKLQLRVWHEMHQFTGFIRFREIQNQILFSSINPENQILALLEPHFSDRFPQENWIIYDESRSMALVHPAGKNGILYHGAEISSEFLQKQPGEVDEYEELWKEFCSSIAIKGRINKSLQRQNLPLRYRSNMSEFHQ